MIWRARPGDDECKSMVDKTVPHMTPSVVSGGSTSYERKSYSVNMYPDFEANSNLVRCAASTHISRRAVPQLLSMRSDALRCGRRRAVTGAPCSGHHHHCRRHHTAGMAGIITGATDVTAGHDALAQTLLVCARNGGLHRAVTAAVTDPSRPDTTRHDETRPHLTPPDPTRPRRPTLPGHPSGEKSSN